MTRFAISVIGIAFCCIGCSTTHVQPEIETFAATVKAAAAAAEQTFESNQLDEELAREARENLVQNNAFYLLEGRCRQIRPAVLLDFNDPASTSFRENCALATKVTSNLEDFDNKLPESDVVRANNARKAVRALRRYALALQELAVADTPHKVSTAAAGSITALHKLGVAVLEIKEETPSSPNVQKVVDAGSGFVSLFAKEALEARRYSLLASIVREADSAVRDTSQAAAVWYHSQDEAQLERGYEQLNALVDNAIGGSAVDLEKVETAYAALEKQSETARWRVFAQIAQTHSSIRASFDEPLDSARLAQANVRIRELVKKTDAFLKAVDADTAD